MRNERSVLTDDERTKRGVVWSKEREKRVRNAKVGETWSVGEEIQMGRKEKVEGI